VAEEIYVDANLRDDLGSTLSTVQASALLEDDLVPEVDEEEARSMQSVQDIIAFYRTTPVRPAGRVLNVDRPCRHRAWAGRTYRSARTPLLRMDGGRSGVSPISSTRVHCPCKSRVEVDIEASNGSNGVLFNADRFTFSSAVAAQLALNDSGLDLDAIDLTRVGTMVSTGGRRNQREGSRV